MDIFCDFKHGKNKEKSNEFTDSEKIAIEEADGHQRVGSNLRPNPPHERITLERKALRVTCMRAVNRRLGFRAGGL